MTLSDSAIIVIVLVGCLAITALVAAIFHHYNPRDNEARRFNASYEQGQYMRDVRMKNYHHLRQESLGARKDLESRYTADEASAYHPGYASQEPVSPSTNI
ncbi:uncharacterized protein N7459_005724 [Penicillium hispanicum]|uniref:uncharacterized protein n=1 Tax=Penicillium hispanicum TaxID=1080232 RepID=UPI0025418149|nr:uncharacterized protein N7459_005724 [Penicillium hispanicum]KAJ5579739.1 hypothetical protein N7459_005724 [Penicillium hispanicum]